MWTGVIWDQWQALVNNDLSGTIKGRQFLE